MRPARPHLYRRGKRGTDYFRRRIPTEVPDAGPRGVREILRSLRTRDPQVAERTLRSPLVDLDREFALKSARVREQRRRPLPQRVTTLAPGQLHDLAKVWVTAVLETDGQARRNGLDDAEFQSLGDRIAAQRTELGQMLARGDTRSIIPAMHGFLTLCGIDARLSAADEQRAGHAFLEAVVTALSHQADRQDGKAVNAAAAAGAMRPPSNTCR